QSALHGFALPGRVRLTERARRGPQTRPSQVLGLLAVIGCPITASANAHDRDSELITDHAALSRPVGSLASAPRRRYPVVHVQPQVRPQLRHGGESIERTRDAEQTRKAAEPDTRG